MTLIISLVVLIAFTCRNFYLTDYFQSDVYFQILGGMILLTVVYLFLPREVKIEHQRLLIFPILLLLIGLSLNVEIYYRHLLTERFSEVFRDYGSLDCDELHSRFFEDLKKGELKYFSVGIAPPEIEEDFADIDIENYHQGTFFSGHLQCYNELVEQHVKYTYNVDIGSLFKTGL